MTNIEMGNIDVKNYINKCYDDTYRSLNDQSEKLKNEGYKTNFLSEVEETLEGVKKDAEKYKRDEKNVEKAFKNTYYLLVDDLGDYLKADKILQQNTGETAKEILDKVINDRPVNEYDISDK